MRLPENFNPEQRGELAEQFFRKGYNCCQSVMLAFADIIEDNGFADSKTLSVIASGFGGGMGRLREVCGSFSACVMMAGFISPAESPDIPKRTVNYALVRGLADDFREANGGSIVCAELLGLKERKPESPKPSDRTEEYYGKRPCPQIIRNAAQIVARRILQIQESAQ